MSHTRKNNQGKKGKRMITRKQGKPGFDQSSEFREKKNLPPLPESMRKLALDSRGYPVPWFVHHSRGIPDFRYVDGWKFAHAVTHKTCWVCGEPLRSEYHSFIAGPMVAVERVSPEPPCHGECAQYSTQVCPFLTTPERERRQDGSTPPEAHTGGGDAFLHNPGVSVIWTTADYRVVDRGNGMIFELGDPSGVLWMCRGRPATRHEAIDVLRTGMDLLENLARERGGEVAAADTRRRYYAALVLLPIE